MSNKRTLKKFCDSNETLIVKPIGVEATKKRRTNRPETNEQQPPPPLDSNLPSLYNFHTYPSPYQPLFGSCGVFIHSNTFVFSKPTFLRKSKPIHVGLPLAYDYEPRDYEVVYENVKLTFHINTHERGLCLSCNVDHFFAKNEAVLLNFSVCTLSIERYENNACILRCANWNNDVYTARQPVINFVSACANATDSCVSFTVPKEQCVILYNYELLQSLQPINDLLTQSKEKYEVLPDITDGNKVKIFGSTENYDIFVEKKIPHHFHPRNFVKTILPSDATQQAEWNESLIKLMTVWDMYHNDKFLACFAYKDSVFYKLVLNHPSIWVRHLGKQEDNGAYDHLSRLLHNIQSSNYLSPSAGSLKYYESQEDKTLTSIKSIYVWLKPNGMKYNNFSLFLNLLPHDYYVSDFRKYMWSDNAKVNIECINTLYDGCQNRPWRSEWNEYLMSGDTAVCKVNCANLQKTLEHVVYELRSVCLKCREDSKLIWTRNMIHCPENVSELEAMNKFVDKMEEYQIEC
jgi:hypothetical protein